VLDEGGEDGLLFVLAGNEEVCAKLQTLTMENNILSKISMEFQLNSFSKYVFLLNKAMHHCYGNMFP
jgi:hypothetical protein